jgi:putative lipoic acid-binding regulatory protein
MSTDDEARTHALELLQGHHDFPGIFEFRAVVLPESKSATVAAAAAVVGGRHRIKDVTQRQSSRGKYVSVRMSIDVDSPETVLEVYAVLKAVHGVVTLL